MAKLKDDQIRWILSLDAKGVQSELTSISSVVQQLTDDNKKLEAELKLATKQMSDAEKEMKKLAAAGKEDSDAFREAEATYRSAASDIADYTKRIRDNKKAIEENDAKAKEMVKTLRLEDMTMKQLKQRAKELEKQLDDTSEGTHPEVYQALDKELTAVKNRMGELKKSSKEAEIGMKGALQVFAGNMMTKAVDKIKEFVSAGIEWIKTGIGMAKGAEGVVIAFSKLNNSKYHLDEMRSATRNTISDLKLMEKTVRANEMGIGIEKMANLMKFAQIQAGKMKTDVDYMADSIVDGLGRKSTMILDNLGISASKVQAEVKKTGDFTTAVLNIVNERLKEQGDTALTSADKAAQAGVKWENAQLKVGQAFQKLGSIWDEISGNIADGITELIGDTRTLTQQFDDQISTVADLEVNIKPLLARYDELKSKSSLSKDEHKELDTILQKVSEILPIAVTEWDKYGNAISINTQKVYDFIKAEKIRLSLMYEDKIKEKSSELVKYVREFEALQKQIDKLNKGETLYKSQQNTTGYMGGGAAYMQYMPLSDDEIVKLRKRYAEVKGLVLDTNAQIDYMNGTTAEKELLTQQNVVESRNKFRAMNKEALDAWIKDEKNAASEYLQIAKQIYNEKYGTNTTAAASSQKKEADEKKKALEQQLRDLDDYIIREKNKLAQQRLDETLSRDQHQKELERLELEALSRRFEIYDLEPAKQQQVLSLILEYKIKFHEKMLEEEKLFQDEMDTIRNRTSDAEQELSEKTLEKGINNLNAFGKAWKQQQEDTFRAAAEAEAEAERKQRAYISIANSFAEQSGEILTAHMQDAESSTAEFQYNMLMLALDTLRQVVLLATAEAIAKEIGSKGIVGIATGAAAALAINLAFAAVKGLIKKPTTKGSDSSTNQDTTKYQRVNTPGLADGGFNNEGPGTDGGYTGPGGRYQVKGTFPNGVTYHAGEYVIAQPEMKIPAVTKMVYAIEGIRRQRTNSNPIPAGLADGGFNDPDAPSVRSGSAAAGSDNRDILMEIYTFIKNNRLKAEINYQDLKSTELKMTDYENFGNKY